jgi:hypothetical protein
MTFEVLVVEGSFFVFFVPEMMAQRNSNATPAKSARRTVTPTRSPPDMQSQSLEFHKPHFFWSDVVGTKSFSGSLQTTKMSF